LVVGSVFLFFHMMMGKVIRPSRPQAEKLTIYECGEPTVGSAWIQFDLRYYVVALLFVVFDVEVAFFFPWATVYGKAMNLADPKFAAVATPADGKTALTTDARDLYRELGVANPQLSTVVPPALKGRIASDLGELNRSREIVRQGARQLAGFTLIDIAVFFGILMVGFAYVWRRGDLDWVRAVSQQRAADRGARETGNRRESASVLSA
ncbi:MAG: NADH-quinone oxidoreductase subunit A, partial [Planctomycetota bacterium]